MSRPVPFELAFGAFRERFEPLRKEMPAAGKNPRDRDEFLLEREVAGILQELRPEEGFGETTEAVAALLHHGFLFWDAGESVRAVSGERLGRALSGTAETPGRQATARSNQPPRRRNVEPSAYLQLPALAVWGLLGDDQIEPLDGWFRSRSGDELDAIAIFGLRPGRPGFTVLEVRGPPPGLALRDDGDRLFAPFETETGTPAGVAAVTSQMELLELCWRIETTE